jgi:formate-dependent phosphoribosylglycinamide formyltransferase (GAR transformylase)
VEGDPAEPRFAADEPRVASTPFGRIDDEHPLRRALGKIGFPASTERVLSSVRKDSDVDEEQVRWLEGVLPNRVYADAQDVVNALGRWGPPPPTTAPSL